MNSGYTCKQQAIQLGLEKQKKFYLLLLKKQKKNYKQNPLQENMTVIIQPLSFAQILIPKNILLNKYLKLRKSDYWQ